MKATNGEIYGAIQALGELSSKDLPVKVSYWLARLNNKLNSAYKAIETVRTSLIKKYGTAGPNGSFNINPEDANWEPFATGFNELMAEETEIDVSPVNLPIKIPLEVDGKPLAIKMSIFASLENFIEIET